MSQDRLGKADETLHLTLEHLLALKGDRLRLARDLLEKLGGKSSGLVWTERLRLFLRREDLLELVGTVTIPAITVPFIVKDGFVVNTDPDAPVRIESVCDGFRERFFDKTEGPRTKQTLCYLDTRQPSTKDCCIVTELGGYEKVEITLAEVRWLIETQGMGQAGALLNTRGIANTFRVKDNHGRHNLVMVIWGRSGWILDALNNAIFPWHNGVRVFSRAPAKT